MNIKLIIIALVIIIIIVSVLYFLGMLDGTFLMGIGGGMGENSPGLPASSPCDSC